MHEISWLKSHVVRAPLARVMGLIDCLKHSSNSEKEKVELLGHVINSVVELDVVIREIVRKIEKVKVILMSLKVLVDDDEIIFFT